jgi:type I restriction enzyme S subunit
MNNIFDSFEIEVYLVSSSNINLENCRLNPSFYSSNQEFISRLQTTPLAEICEEIFMGPIFKREEVLNEKFGVRFLTSNEIISLEPKIGYISKKQAEKLNLVVNKSMILTTGYGTIGSTRIVDNIIDGFSVADNVTRIIPSSNLGFIACFLSSHFGQNLLNDYASGAVVKFIKADSISKIPIPILTQEVVLKTNQLYLDAVKYREKAYKLLEQAKDLVLEYNNLPLLDDTELETLDPEKETDINLVSNNEFTQDYRLDAHFYNPMANLVVKNIKDYSADFQRLEESVNDIVLGKRFKRNYVESNHGKPFLSGKNIIQIRPDVKYLSNTETGFMDELLIKKNWILITRSGTIGRTCFVYNNYENYAASEHILRVIPNEVAIDSGYLYCFLSTDYGYHQTLRYKYGAVIDEIDDGNIANILIPICSPEQQKEIGDLIRQAYDLRAEAIRLEDEAQEILTKALTGGERVL